MVDVNLFAAREGFLEVPVLYTCRFYHLGAEYCDVNTVFLLFFSPLMRFFLLSILLFSEPSLFSKEPPFSFQRFLQHPLKSSLYRSNILEGKWFQERERGNLGQRGERERNLRLKLHPSLTHRVFSLFSLSLSLSFQLLLATGEYCFLLRVNI